MTLLRCPFCGDREINVDRINHRFFPDLYEITCPSEDCQATISAVSWDEVVRRWNRRVDCQA
jgi:hypothetical protein